MRVDPKTPAEQRAEARAKAARTIAAVDAVEAARDLPAGSSSMVQHIAERDGISAQVAAGRLKADAKAAARIARGER